jgi:phosphonate transport system substrate-binding protein
MHRVTRVVFAVLALVLAMSLAQPARAADPQELVFIFQKQKDPTRIQKDADELAAYLTKEVGVPVKAVVPGDYSASVQALVNKKADFAYVSAMPFLLARRDGNASLLLAEQRTDVASGKPQTFYNSIIVVPKDSPIQSVSDIVANAKDLRIVFTSPTSTSGYIMAYYRLVKDGLLKPRQDPKDVFKSVAFGGGYTQALEQLLRGDGDVAAVSDYVLEGPKTDVYLTAEQRSKLRIVARTPGVPTHLIAAREGLSDEIKTKVKQALLKVGNEKPELLADVYGATAFVEVDGNEHVAKAVEAIEYIGLPIEGLAK